jgi:hypothetical protein
LWNSSQSSPLLDLSIFLGFLLDTSVAFFLKVKIVFQGLFLRKFQRSI